ncbi:hypothetical protein GA0070616_1360 [Micromonospora nigra]|uniref:Uncharacterized protein n=1 Tax=Micromonospora nigra TaxID=145857 RepID=A0A1C6RKV2_9ACTN|nr:hypothetical protein [Micromonospora nigra]SCL17795.1 hypothetical protein GA0070616_1360 [Micromonospora nigra]
MNDTDPRQAAWQLAADGVAAGLPIPEHTTIGDSAHNPGQVTLHLRDNDAEAVERWAAWLDLPAPEMTLSPIASKLHTSGWFRPYEARTTRHPSTGHHVVVKTYVSVPAPADVEAVAR